MKNKQINKLVEAMVQGDNKAFEKLYKETSRTVYFICLSFLNNEQDAQDVMQGVYITVYNKISQLQDKEKFVPWINQIAVNKCKNQLLKNTPMPMDPEDYEQMPVEPGEIFLPEDYIVDKEKRKIIMDIMSSSLSDIQYRTVILFYFNNLGINEIAEIMECPPGTVSYRLSVARGKLKQGILNYETANDYKLHASAGIPLLASILAAEAVGLQVPNIFPSIMSIITNGAMAGAGYAMSGVAAATVEATGSAGTVAGGTAGVSGVTAGVVGTTTAKVAAGLALKAKIAIAVAATVVIGGGAVAVGLHKLNKEEPKEIVEYEVFVPNSADELRDYFVEEHGFFEVINAKLSDEGEIPMMGYHLTRENENGGLRIEITYYVEGNKIRDVQIWNYEREGKSNRDDFVDMSTVFINNSEEKEQLLELIENDSTEKQQIGDETYYMRFYEGAYYDKFANGFSAPVAHKYLLAIIVDW